MEVLVIWKRSNVHRLKWKSDCCFCDTETSRHFICVLYVTVSEDSSEFVFEIKECYVCNIIHHLLEYMVLWTIFIEFHNFVICIVLQIDYYYYYYYYYAQSLEDEKTDCQILWCNTTLNTSPLKTLLNSSGPRIAHFTWRLHCLIVIIVKNVSTWSKYVSINDWL